MQVLNTPYKNLFLVTLCIKYQIRIPLRFMKDINKCIVTFFRGRGGSFSVTPALSEQRNRKALIFPWLWQKHPTKQEKTCHFFLRCPCYQ